MSADNQLVFPQKSPFVQCHHPVRIVSHQNIDFIVMNRQLNIMKLYRTDIRHPGNGKKFIDEFTVFQIIYSAGAVKTGKEILFQPPFAALPVAADRQNQRSKSGDLFQKLLLLIQCIGIIAHIAAEKQDIRSKLPHKSG